MKICAAQTRSFKGDISRNLIRHIDLINLSLTREPDLILFPELSLTGYEPELASWLSVREDVDAPWATALAELSNTHQISIGAGMPVWSEAGPCIGLFLFIPVNKREVYLKQYLHQDEYPYFSPGNPRWLEVEKENDISLSICYEINVDEHARLAYDRGAMIYLASVAKSGAGMEQAHVRLNKIASGYGLKTLIANSVGPSDNFLSGGRSAYWNEKGKFIAQMDGEQEGILLVDTTKNSSEILYLKV